MSALPPPGSQRAPLARIGVLGDIHAEDASLDVVLRFLEDAGVDQVMSVGDIVDGPGSVDRCCELLMSAGALAVRGNHERWFLAGTMRELPEATQAVGAEGRAFLASLPRTRRFETVAEPVLLCHGLGDDDMASVAPDENERTIRYNHALAPLIDADKPEIVINGHTHRRSAWSFRKLTVINAGTLYRQHQPCFLIVDLTTREATWFDLDSDLRIARKETQSMPPPRGARR
jgi:predicted phosphodiesterase